MTRYSCYDGRYNGYGEHSIPTYGHWVGQHDSKMAVSKTPTKAPMAKRDNCDGTFYKDEPWCCSISCTYRGYLDCKENGGIRWENQTHVNLCARLQRRNVLRKPQVRILQQTEAQTYFFCINMVPEAQSLCTAYATKPTECRDLYVTKLFKPHTIKTHILSKQEDKFGRACLPLHGSKTVGAVKNFYIKKCHYQNNYYLQWICVCYIQKRTNPGYLPCNTPGNRIHCIFMRHFCTSMQ